MAVKNAEITKQAREALDGRWWFVVGVMLLYFIIMAAIGNIPLVPLVLGGPLTLGLCIFSLSIARKEKNTKLVQIFQGFNRFEDSLVAYLLVLLYTLLWTLLFIIPGIIASIAYSQTFFILADDNKIDPEQAIKKSKEMMKGYKWKFVCLNFRFIGWALLSVLTLGIGFIFLIPYIQISQTKFYEDIKNAS
jgi:uncharacterized membrane protein